MQLIRSFLHEFQRSLKLSLAGIILSALLIPAHAAVVLVGSSTAKNNALPTDRSSGSLTITTPANVRAGMALIATLSTYPRGLTMTAPSGWTLLETTNQINGGASRLPGGMALSTYYRIASGNEPASHTWTLSNSAGSGASYGGGVVGGILAFSGVDTSGATPIDMFESEVSIGASLTQSAPRILPNVDNALLVSAISFLSAGQFNAPTGPSSIVERLDNWSSDSGVIGDANGVTLQMATAALANKGRTANVVSQATGTTADYGVGHTLTLKPANVDLDIQLTRNTAFASGGTGSYGIMVFNNGIFGDPGPVTITNTLPMGLSYTSYSGAGWSCSAAAQIVTCSRAGLPSQSFSTLLTLNVSVSTSPPATITNSVSVSGASADGNLANNTDEDTYAFPQASSFGAYETNISTASAATLANRVIQTRVATESGQLCPSGINTMALLVLPTGSKTCSLTVAAFNDSQLVATNYSGSVSVKLQACASVARSGPGNNDAVTCAPTSTWTDITTTQNVTLTNGLGLVVFPAVNNAYEVVRVSIFSAGLNVSSTSSDYFAIRPFGLSLAASDASSSAPGTARSLNNLANTHLAGSPFTVSARAYAGTLTTPGYPGTAPGPVVLSVNTTSAAGTTGAFDLGTLSGTGVLSSANASYGEVGNVNLSLQDVRFSNVDKDDGSTATERFVTSPAVTIGRFVPHHFEVTTTQACTLGATPFTYSGQPFPLILTARNQQGNTTTNYSASLGLSKSVDLSALGGLAGTLSPLAINANTFTAGAASLTVGNGPTYTYTSKKTAPSNVSIRAIDTDGVTSDPLSGGSEGTILVRSGQLKVFSTTGGDRSAMRVPLALQYWSGQTWLGHADDVCTSLSAAHVALTSKTNSAASYTSSTPVFSSGAGHVMITPSASTASPAGSLNLAIHLGASGVDQSCFAEHGGIGAGKPWLRSFFGSCSALADRDPGAILRFGAHVDESRRQMHIREIR